MNDLEKRSFYSFLGLYLLSSFLFILLTGYWYYAAQKNALEKETYYRMEHIADLLSGRIIMAHMHHRALVMPKIPSDFQIAMIDTSGNIVKGTLPVRVDLSHTGYSHIHGYTVLVSDAPQEHLHIRYVVVSSDILPRQLADLRNGVLLAMGAVALLVTIVAWLLSRLFMRPIRQKIAQIERFVNDITHELNTPISALRMAAEQIRTRPQSTRRMLEHIEISTRQLYDIYRSLTYLTFARPAPQPVPLDLASVLEESIAYYGPLAERKRIMIEYRSEPTPYTMEESEAKLLFGNLISNAIKYSPAGSTIRISLEERRCTIEDQGIGIDPKKQSEIFERFERASEYAGGFGVGLSIVKRICERYGIPLSLRSHPGAGSAFTLRF